MGFSCKLEKLERGHWPLAVHQCVQIFKAHVYLTCSLSENLSQLLAALSNTLTVNVYQLTIPGAFSTNKSLFSSWIGDNGLRWMFVAVHIHYLARLHQSSDRHVNFRLRLVFSIVDLAFVGTIKEASSFPVERRRPALLAKSFSTTGK